LDIRRILLERIKKGIEPENNETLLKETEENYTKLMEKL